MSAETMIHFLNHCTSEEKFGFRVVTQCAPVLKGVKISNLITMKPGGWRKIRAYLKKSRIICIPLYADAEKEVLFLYRYEQLERHLKNREVCEFLRSCGYDRFDVASILARLKRRYQRYAGISEEFPHELGVLLGYPVGDVQGFIANLGSIFLPGIPEVENLPSLMPCRSCFMPIQTAVAFLIRQRQMILTEA